MFARYLKWTPSSLADCRMGDLDDLWRDLLYPMWERDTVED